MLSTVADTVTKRELYRLVYCATVIANRNELSGESRLSNLWLWVGASLCAMVLGFSGQAAVQADEPAALQEVGDGCDARSEGGDAAAVLGEEGPAAGRARVPGYKDCPDGSPMRAIGPDMLQPAVTEPTISAEVEPRPGMAQAAAKALQEHGFRILHIGGTISVEAPQSLWEATFNVSFETHTKRRMAEVQETEITYQKAVTEAMRIPETLQKHIAAVLFAEPPELF